MSALRGTSAATGWVTADVSDDETLESALEWLRESYWLKAKARLRGAVEQT
jgi:hypothetical protein